MNRKTLNNIKNIVISSAVAGGLILTGSAGWSQAATPQVAPSMMAPQAGESSLYRVALKDVGKSTVDGQPVARKSLFVVTSQMRRAGYPMKRYAYAAQVATKAQAAKKLRKGVAPAGAVYVWGPNVGGGAGLIAVSAGGNNAIGVLGTNTVRKFSLAGLPKPAGWIAVSDLKSL